MEAYYVDIIINVKDFEDILELCCSNLSSKECEWSSEDCSSISGKSLKSYTIKQASDNSVLIEIVGEYDSNSNEITFGKLGLKSYNTSWYIEKNIDRIDENDIDTFSNPSMLMVHCLCDAAEKIKGSIVCIDYTNDPVAVIDGMNVDSHKIKKCLLVGKNVYGVKEVLPFDSNVDNNVTYNIKLFEWINKTKTTDPSLHETIAKAGKGTAAKMVSIGMYLVKAKANGTITQDEFRQLFMQCAALSSNFQDNNTLNMIYRLFV